VIDSTTARDILASLRAYTADRDAMSRAAQNQSAFSLNSAGIAAASKFSEMSKIHANTLMREFPTMNLDDLQALSELIGVALGNARMYEQQGR
jgi:hypothetical protein